LKDQQLFRGSVNIPILPRRSRRRSCIQRTPVEIPAVDHFSNELFVSSVERPQFTAPPHRFRMMRVSFFSPRYNRPYRVKLPMFAEQMSAA